MASSFESVYRSEQGAAEIEKIYNFLMGLIIKNKYEANAAETSESASEYFKYYGAYTKTDSFSDYLKPDKETYMNIVYTYMSSLKNRNYNFSLSTLKTITNMTSVNLQKGYDNGLQIYKDYLLSLRVARVYLYDEKNTYYRQFMGLPNKTADYVYVTDYDISDDGYTEITDFTVDPIKNLIYYTKIDGKYVSLGAIESWYDVDTKKLIADNFYVFNVIPIHTVTAEKYPLTYSYYIQQKNIDKLIEDNEDLTYLRFIGKNYTAYYLHELPNYSIIQYDSSVLSSIEQEYFFKSYNKAKTQVVADYIEGFDKKQPLYNLLMIQNLLYYTVINYTNSYIEKYSVGIYSEKNLDDILNSHGYSKLTKISSVELKERIVKNLNDLISNKGNNYILELILDRIIKDDTSELKRYYLEKKYNTDSEGQIKIDTSRGLEHSVDLVFREVPATQLDSVSNNSDSYKNYDEMTYNDELWGGIEDSDTQNTRNTKRAQLKKQLLALNFNSILTRYITLISTVDILDSQRKLRDALYLMFNYFNNKELPDFFYNKITVESFTATPAAVFAAMCWLQQMKSYKNPDTIVKNNIVINNSAAFRNFGKLVVDRQSFENTVIYNGEPVTQYDISTDVANWRVEEFIKDNPDVFTDFFTTTGVETERIETVRIKDVLFPSKYEKTGTNTWTKTKPKISADGYKNMTDATETIDDYMPVYRFYANGVQLGDVTADTTFSDILNDYQHQMPNLIQRISNKLATSYDFNTYQAWLFLQTQARKDNSILYIFKDYTKFSSFISEFCDSGEMITWLETQLKVVLKTESKYTKPQMSDICTVLETLTADFKNWVNTGFSTLVYKNNELSGDISYIDDMRILFNEFLSVYSELYSVDFKYTLGNKEISDYCLQLYYNPTNILFTQKFNENIELLEELKSKVIMDLNSDDTEEDVLTLIYDFYNKSYTETDIAINNNIIKDEKTKEYIPEDPFVYEPGFRFKTKVNDWVGLDDGFSKINPKVLITDDVGLHGMLKVKTNEGVKYYDE